MVDRVPGRIGMSNNDQFAVGTVQPVSLPGSDAVGGYAGGWFGRKSNTATVPVEEPLSIPAGADDEFNIKLIRSGRVWVLCFDFWHEDFYDRASAIQLIKEALAGGLRLRIDRMGAQPVQWAVERLGSDGRWIELYVSRVLRFGWSQKLDSIWRRAPKVGNLEI